MPELPFKLTLYSAGALISSRRAAARHNLTRSMRRQELLDALFHLAFNAESEELQVSAAVAWLDRVEGKPTAL